MSSQVLVLFDIDGTLLRNAGPHHKNALAEGIFQVTGIRTTLDGVATSGMLDCDLITGMMRAKNVDDEKIGQHMDEIMEASQIAYLAACAATLEDKVCPGVHSVLRRLRDEGAVLGVVTGNLSRIGWKKLELAGLRSYFALGAFAESGPTRSELARMARLEAIDRGLIDSNAKVSLVGDHTNDINAAKANGYRSVAVATGFLSTDKLSDAGPDIVIKDLTDLNIDQLL
jgi:phosphoglycolate phosphatase